MPNHILLAARVDSLLGRGAAAGVVVTIGPDRLTQLQQSAWYVSWSASAVGGEVVLETAPKSGYAGTWAVLHRFEWVAGGRVQWCRLEGPYLALRVRIVKPIIEGEVEVYGIGN